MQIPNRPGREPPADWRRHHGDSHRECNPPPGHGPAPTFLWGGKQAARASRRASRRLDPDGCLVRFGSQPAGGEIGRGEVSAGTNEGMGRRMLTTASGDDVTELVSHGRKRLNAALATLAQHGEPLPASRGRCTPGLTPGPLTRQTFSSRYVVHGRNGTH